jgi:hypothetical protein
MIFLVTPTRTPEPCPAGVRARVHAPAAGMQDLARGLNIRIREIFSCPTGHTSCFVLEAGECRDITAFFSGIMLTNHTGRITPVVALDGAAALIR